jgi:hypothetical protein
MGGPMLMRELNDLASGIGAVVVGAVTLAILGLVLGLVGSVVKALWEAWPWRKWR